MAKGIEFQKNNRVPDIMLNSVPPDEPETLLIELPPEKIGSENGAIFFELDRQNQQAENLRQRLTANFSDTLTAPEPTADLTNSNNREIEPASEDLMFLSNNHEDSAELPRSPNNLRQQISQLSEPLIIRDENGNQRQMTTRFDKPAAKMNEQNFPLKKFAETLPPNKKDALAARFQPQQTFGANVSNVTADGEVLPDKAAQTSFRDDSTNAVDSVAEFHNGELPLPGETTIASDEKTLFGAEIEAIIGAKNLPINEPAASAPQKSKIFTAGSAALPNAAPEALPKFTPADSAPEKTIKPESFVRGNLNFTAAENKADHGAIVRHDDAKEIGGALINGAFAAVENYKNAEKPKTRDSEAGRNIYGAGGGLAAGVNGAMFGAAVGKVIPGAGKYVGGVLGFVSGVIVGVESDRGWRLSGTGAMNFQAITAVDNSVNQTQSVIEYFSPSGANLQLTGA